MFQIFRQIQIKLVLGAIAALFAAVLLTVMLVFASIAVYDAFTDMLAPWAAALATAGAAIVALIVILLLLKMVGAMAKGRRPPRGEFPFDLVRQVTQGRTRGPNSSALGVFGLFALGFALGASPRLRSMLLRLL